MKNLILSIPYRYASLEELIPEDQHLIQTAITSTQKSYAPYSHFNVGAAVRLDNGREIPGANQENAAYPSGLCAERTAVFAAQAWYPEQPIEALAIAACTPAGLLQSPVTPCGACRQVILEIESRYQKSVKILLYGTEGVLIFKSIKDLLPFSFTDTNLQK